MYKIASTNNLMEIINNVINLARAIIATAQEEVLGPEEIRDGIQIVSDICQETEVPSFDADFFAKAIHGALLRHEAELDGCIYYLNSG